MMPLLFSCGNKEGTTESEVTEAEERERDKTGNVYNSDEQGVDIENRDNQFNTSRNDNTEGYGQETGAPSDTIDNDGDKKVNNTQRQ
jgi:hypothetical protein